MKRRLVAVCVVIFFGLFVNIQLLSQYNKGSNQHNITPTTRGTTTNVDADTVVRVPASSPSHQNRIPRRLIFTYRTNLLKVPIPAHFAENVQRTISMYKAFWENHDNHHNKSNHDTNITVVFLDDKDCIRVLREAIPELVPFFVRETHGDYKGDLCRTAELYQRGGMYLDIDMKVIQPYDPNIQHAYDSATNASMIATFVTAMSARLPLPFQAILFARSKSPLLKRTLEEMVAYYHGRWTLNIAPVLGCHALDRAYKSMLMTKNESSSPGVLLTHHQQQEHIHFLQETDLYLPSKKPLYPNISRQKRTSWGCQLIVHDPIGKQPYFFSRIPGTRQC